MPSEPAPQNPPPLTQDPEELTVKPVFVPTKENRATFDFTKVMAAIGVILTATLIIIAVLWIYVQSLEQRIKGLETDIVTNNSVTKISTSSATPSSTNSATPSADQGE